MKRFGEVLTVVSLSAAVALGETACSNSDQSSPKPRPSSSSIESCDHPLRKISKINIIGTAKDGGINAVNQGACANIYLTTQSTPTDTLFSGQAFEFLCRLAPTAYKISYNDNEPGYLSLQPGLEAQLAQQVDFTNLPRCIPTPPGVPNADPTAVA